MVIGTYRRVGADGLADIRSGELTGRDIDWISLSSSRGSYVERFRAVPAAAVSAS
jgi:hypothetical protein